MPSLKRKKTNYPGVFYIEGTAVGSGKTREDFLHPLSQGREDDRGKSWSAIPR